MAYTEGNFNTKNQLKQALSAGRVIRVFQPGPFGPKVPDGLCTLEGPHYPKPHTWYASCRVQQGVIIPGTLK